MPKYPSGDSDLVVIWQLSPQENETMQMYMNTVTVGDKVIGSDRPSQFTQKIAVVGRFDDSKTKAEANRIGNPVRRKMALETLAGAHAKGLYKLRVLCFCANDMPLAQSMLANFKRAGWLDLAIVEVVSVPVEAAENVQSV